MKSNFEKDLGSSKGKALAQFRTLERKFIQQENMEKDYKLFMQEYQSLGHMKLAASNTKPDCHMTHHSVQRTESTTTKFRVVFNASVKTSSGLSLNDVMLCGPNLQQDLQSLIIKWRQYQYAFTADIEKMFRQIWIHEEDQKLQKIIWRDARNVPIKEYQLTTVTYGTKSAPFLAMMTLKQLAIDEKPNYVGSQAADVLDQSFYMDDLLHGSHSIEAAKQLHDDLIRLLKSGGFNLRKWRSNIPELSDDSYKSNNQDSFNFKQAEYTKTLGLCWNPHLDVFTFQYKIDQSLKPNTKRSLLSDISKLFDPLGWLAPLSTKLKIIFQNVWLSNISWDDQLPENIKTEWEKVKQDINNLNKLQIPRWIYTKECHKIELHGFCDSSIKAYACVIYGKINDGDKISIPLLVAKTRLVPVGKKISLPRLELSGALLLSRLMSKVKQCLSNYQTEVYGWSDSMVVLGWLSGDPGRWKTFVANRVQEIINIMPRSCWRYIKSEHNPADCASRGITALQLIEHNLWWQGPSLLQNNCYKEIQQQYFTWYQEVKKAKHVNVAEHVTENSIIYQLLSKYSSFNKVIRILSWILRLKYKPEHKQSFLSISELRRSRNIIIKNVQEATFAKEIISLRDSNKFPTKSTINQLNPFLDKNNILRVGGRLRNTHLDPEMKHPIIIPGHCRLAELLIDQSHELTFHGGARLTSAFLRHKYWIIGGNNIVKKRLRGCVTCKRHDPVKHNQIMGDLPAARTTPTRPFYHTGVDYTGFVDVKSNKGRGVKTSKGYIAVFVCMVTKAVHLELVSDLSSSSFLSALRRMAARRGTPRHIYSDNGTNFVGASRTINQEYLDLKSTLDSSFFTAITEMEIQWHFNAPSWPSAGGLWEAAVRSLKYHLKRVIGEQKLTFEEYSTLLAQLEACLNARPLCTLTEDPGDLNYLTPSHFLASGPTLTIMETERDHRTRWQLTQKIFDDIWKRWRIEYLCQLSARSKWRQSQANLNINDVVIIHDANLPAGRWALGRIIELHPGKDGYVRVVSIKTKNGIVKRPITKISKLPINVDQTDHTQLKQDQLKKECSASSSRSCGTATIGHPNKYSNFLFSILLWLILINTSVHGQYEVSNLNTSRGFYFDKITNMRLQRDEWKLVIYYDMNPYWQGTELVTKYMNHLDNICFNANKRIEQCDVILLQLHHGLAGLEHYNSILLGQQFTRSGMRTRLRRGLINGVGYIAHSLFGVLDEQFAEQYKNDIETIKDNEKHLVILWKNQTSVVEAEFNLIKRVEDTMNKQHKIFNQHLNNLEKAFNSQGVELENVASTTEFTVSSIIANSMLTNLQNIQETLIDTITNVYIGKFNYHLLPPEQLRDELNVIAGLLTKDLSLPLEDIQSDLSKMYHLLNVRARASKKFIIFEVRIPLVSRDNFEIFKLIPIPQRIKSNAITIVPVSDYVAINIQKDSYIPMSEKDIQHCMNYDFNTHLCASQQPIYQTKLEENLCNKDQASDKCLTKTSNCKNTWTELSNINTYLFYCCGQCTVRIIRENHIAAEILREVGIISLSDKCIIKGSTFTIFAHKLQSKILNKEADILKIEIPPINKIINLSVPVSTVENQSTVDHQKSFEYINRQIQQLKQDSEGILTERVSYHDVHHYVAIYLVVLVAVALGAAFLWRRCRVRTQPEPPATGQAEEAVV
ncbi:hypothetical protein O3G_MSEX008494 [Manduca sexta]|uniref:Integrase catalytic domain-containing protein n=1 Tax=Manduca sexta TaxID=7130 RepID=A0A921ZAK4_MANSE|nr:hypothetical protein O3G_MSEX008494 [Manduca sexta]